MPPRKYVMSDLNRNVSAKMKKLFLITLFVISSPALASEKFDMRSAITGQNCSMVETASVSMSFNEQGIDLAKASKLMDEKRATVQEVATGLGIEGIELQSYSYNVYANNNGGCGGSTASTENYQFNGNLSFLLRSADKSEALMKALSEKGFYVNFNLNAYRQCQ